MKIILSKINSSKPNRLTKTLHLQDGGIVSRPGGHMVLGMVQVIVISCLLGLAEVILGLNKNQALCYGLPKGAKEGYQNEIKVEKLLTEYDEAIARSNQYFEFNPDGPGVLMIDYDPKSGEEPRSPEVVIEHLRSGVPELRNVKMLWLPSASSDIYNNETGEKMAGIKGQRLYIIVDRASDIPSFGKIIFKRLWLAGHGYVKIGSCGQLLVRTLVDPTVWQPSRLDFASGADCESPLEQIRTEPKVIDGEKDTLLSLEPLTPEEENEFSRLVREAKEIAKPHAEKKFEEYLEKESAKLPADQREAFVARQRAKSKNSYLFGDDMLFVINAEGCEEHVSVQEVLDNPHKYDKCRILDPLDPDYGNRDDVGILNLLDGQPNAYLFNRQTCFKLVRLNEFGLPDAELARLADMTPMEYERVRKETAKEFGVRVSFLDQAVDHQRSANVCLPASTPFLPEWAVKPYSQAVNPGKLADEIYATLCKFVVADPIFLMVVAMWCMLTWLINKASVLPRLVISAPDKGCGKTVCLTAVGLVAQRSLQSSSISPASFFRLVQEYQPTILIDEADTLPKDSDQLRGLLNAGHTRESANVIRTEEVNGQYTPVIFGCFCPVALAGIKLEKKLSGTVLSRGILIQLRKKLPGEKVQKIRRASKAAMIALREKLARFAIDFGEQFEKLEPELEELGNRDGDNWEPLLAIAELCGPEWQERIKQAAIAMTADSNAESIDVRLLRDIKAIFENKKTDQVTTSDMIDGLAKMETAPWRQFSRGMCINARQIADRLEPFGIKPAQLGVNPNDGKNRRGYRRSDFADAFERYLGEPQTTPEIKKNDDDSVDWRPHDEVPF